MLNDGSKICLNKVSERSFFFFSFLRLGDGIHTVWLNLVVLIVREQDIPDFFPLGLGRGSTDPLSRQELDRGSTIDS